MNTRTTNEVIRVSRTLTQSLVGAGAAWLLSKGVDINVDATIIFVLPVLVAAITAAVRFVEDNIPALGDLIGFLNGPSGTPSYTKDEG